MWMKGRMWKWREKKVFVSFSRENRSFLFCGCISNFASVYHLILLVPPPAASGSTSVQSWMIAASRDAVQVLGTPVQSFSESQSQEPWQTQGKPQLLLAALIPVLDAGTWAEWGFWEQAGKRRKIIVEMPLFTSVVQLHLSSSTFCEQVLLLYPSAMNYSFLVDEGDWGLAFTGRFIIPT